MRGLRSRLLWIQIRQDNPWTTNPLVSSHMISITTYYLNVIDFISRGHDAEEAAAPDLITSILLLHPDYLAAFLSMSTYAFLFVATSADLSTIYSSSCPHVAITRSRHETTGWRRSIIRPRLLTRTCV